MKLEKFQNSSTQKSKEIFTYRGAMDTKMTNNPEKSTYFNIFSIKIDVKLNETIINENSQQTTRIKN